MNTCQNFVTLTSNLNFLFISIKFYKKFIRLVFEIDHIKINWTNLVTKFDERNPNMSSNYPLFFRVCFIFKICFI